MKNAEIEEPSNQRMKSNQISLVILRLEIDDIHTIDTVEDLKFQNQTKINNNNIFQLFNYNCEINFKKSFPIFPFFNFNLIFLFDYKLKSSSIPKQKAD